jgi:hypothetical protein
MGPTRDGRIKPEITATGDNIVTTGALPILTWLIANQPWNVTQDSLHMIFDGTSAAAPAVAGLAALYFEKYPTATATQLIDDVTNCSVHDIFTGQTPNDLWGYGKLDGFGALMCSIPGDVGTGENKRVEPFHIYPNPSKDNITIVSTAVPCNFAVHDLVGRHIMTIRQSQQRETFDLQSLQNGLYFITKEGSSSVVKLIRCE